MKKLTSDDPETKSADLIAENITQLKALFPEAFTEGEVDFEVLKALLGGAVDEREEKFGLNWHGKRRARQLALTPSNGTLRPCPAESVDWETTKNIVIEGDNLEVLKLLQKSYAGKVKLIYIDPPYNTGKDFVYPDDFKDGVRNYLEITRQVNDEGFKISSNTEASGRFHTNWLNMIYPRLKVARNLLRDDGVIFISIDDGESSHLRAMMDEVFGPENFVGNAVWEKAYTANMTAAFLSNTHDHILIYARGAEAAELGRFERSEEQIEQFKNPDNDPRGPWKAENLSSGKYYSAGQFEITGPTGERFKPPSGRYWRCNETQYEKWRSDNRITFGKAGEGRPMLKKFLSEVTVGLTPSTWWGHDEFGTNKEASIELKALFDGEVHFQTPKPVKLLRRIVSLGAATDKDCIVLDFFAGSGSTMHAVFAQNAGNSGGGAIHCILVQLPEPIPEAATGAFQTIADITKERIRRAGKKIRDENPLFKGDTGFRVFKLDSSNIRAWDPDANNLAQSLLDSVQHLKSDRTEQDILFELLLKLGLELTVPIEARVIAGKTVYSVGVGSLLVCLATTLAEADVEPLALGIVAWHRELNTAGEVTLVFRDSAFADDIAKANLTAILQQNGLGTVRSL